MTGTKAFGLGLVINLDRSPGRLEHFHTANEAHFGEIIRVSAVDKDALDIVDIHAFRDASFETAARHPDLNMTPREKDSYWAGSYAVYLSHLAALEVGAMLGGRFMVLEDDAAIRPDLLARTEPAPAEGVLVWGGALKGGGYTAHHRRYERWKSEGAKKLNGWRAVGDQASAVRDRYQATAYEMGEAEATLWTAALQDNPQAYDSSWWLAMQAVPTWVPDTEVIPQKLELGSDRSIVTDRIRRNAAQKGFDIG